MERKWSQIIEDIHLAVLFITAVSMAVYRLERGPEGLAIAGILIGLQCYENIVSEEGCKRWILCSVKLCLLTILIVFTGVWEGCLLYYVVANPESRQKAMWTCTLPGFGMTFLWILNRGMRQAVLFLFLRILILTIAAFFLYGADVLLEQMQNKENLLRLQLEQTAISELKVKRLNRELVQKYQLVERNTRLEERENIARNIHNVVGHTITASIVSLQAYRTLKDVDEQRAQTKFDAVVERLRTALEDIRRAVRLLDEETEDMKAGDFCKMLKAELERFSMDTETKITHNLDEITFEDGIPKKYCEFLHSVLTECLNNGIRHGHANVFYVRVECNCNQIELSVSDNGNGMHGQTKEEQKRLLSEGYGLKKIQKYSTEHGGKVEISADLGFNVKVQLPMFIG